MILDVRRGFCFFSIIYEGLAMLGEVMQIGAGVFYVALKRIIC